MLLIRRIRMMQTKFILNDYLHSGCFSPMFQKNIATSADEPAWRYSLPIPNRRSSNAR